MEETKPIDYVFQPRFQITLVFKNRFISKIGKLDSLGESIAKRKGVVERNNINETKIVIWIAFKMSIIKNPGGKK